MDQSQKKEEKNSCPLGAYSLLDKLINEHKQTVATAGCA